MLGVLLASLGTACGSERETRMVVPPDAERLTGIWDASFVVDRPPLGVDSTELRRSGRDHVRGAVSFLPPIDGVPVVGGDLPELAGAVPVANAVWDIDFTPAGFDPRSTDRVPAAIAAIDTARSPGGPAGQSADSIRIVLGPAAAQRLSLAGAWHGDSIIGHWRVLADGRSNLSAEGRFVLARRQPDVGAPVDTGPR